jgi:hypothetical protein
VVADSITLEIAEADEVPYIIPGVLMDRNPHALIGIKDGGKVVDGERLSGAGGDVEVLASTHGVVEGFGRRNDECAGDDCKNSQGRHCGKRGGAFAVATTLAHVALLRWIFLLAKDLIVKVEMIDGSPCLRMIVKVEK